MQVWDHYLYSQYQEDCMPNNTLNILIISKLISPNHIFKEIIVQQRLPLADFVVMWRKVEDLIGWHVARVFNDKYYLLVHYDM